MTDADLADHLRRAVRSADPGWTAQPSRLQRALADELGPDRHRYRSELHQLVVAADENIPVRLRHTGWSPAACDELATALMAARGWTEAAARWAVTTWAAALDLIDPNPARAAQALADPVPTEMVTDVATAHDDRATETVTDADRTTGSVADSSHGDEP